MLSVLPCLRALSERYCNCLVIVSVVMLLLSLGSLVVQFQVNCLEKTLVENSILLVKQIKQNTWESVCLLLFWHRTRPRMVVFCDREACSG